jgi:hypothetical protein
MKLPFAILAIFLPLFCSAFTKPFVPHEKDLFGVFNPEKDSNPYKYLVGKTGQEAKADIQSKNPKLLVEIVSANYLVNERPSGELDLDYHPNRVRIPVDENGIVVYDPTVG